MIGICAPQSNITNMLSFGFEFVEIKCHDISKIETISNSCFCANSFIPQDKPLFKEKRQFDDSLKYCCEILSICKSKGIKHITFGSGSARSIPQSITKKTVFERWKYFLKTIDIEAHNSGVIVGLEPLVKLETNFINTFSEAQFWIKTLNLKSFGVTFDTFHIYNEINDLNLILKEGLGMVTHIHISDKKQCFPNSINEIPSKLLAYIKNNLSEHNISVEPVPFSVNDITTEFVQELHDWSV